MNDLINNLKIFAVDDFPIKTVSEYISQYKFSAKELNNYCLYKEKKYARHLVHKEKDFEILIVCWKPEQGAPIHGHESEKCWMRIESGALQICNYKLDSINPLELTMISLTKGEVGYLDGPAEIHSVENVYNEPAISLHVYAKPFDKCDIYDLNEGVIRKTELLYDSMYKKPC
jgi:cysteine dioxygenase